MQVSHIWHERINNQNENKKDQEENEIKKQSLISYLCNNISPILSDENLAMGSDYGSKVLCWFFKN